MSTKLKVELSLLEMTFILQVLHNKQELNLNLVLMMAGDGKRMLRFLHI